MTIDSGYLPEVFNLNAARKYNFNFEHIGPETIDVRERNADGASTVMVLGVDYVVNTTPSNTQKTFDGGEVEFLVPHLPDTTKIVVGRTTPATQLLDYQPYGPFPAESHEFGMDKIVLKLQEHDWDIALALADSSGGGTPPPTGAFIPLAGTVSGSPVTGDIEFATGDLSWELSQGNVFGLNALTFGAVSANSVFTIATRDSGGVQQTFRFNADGEFDLPTREAIDNVSWRMKSSDFLGNAHTLWYEPWDNNTQQRGSGDIVFAVNNTNSFVFDENGYITTSGVVTDGNADQVLATVLYVKNSIAGSGNLPPSASGDILIADGLGAWKVSEHFRVNEQSTPGQADMAISGSMAWDNTDTGGISGVELHCRDVLGINTLQFEGYGAPAGFTFADTTVGAGNEITIADGYVLLAKDPDNPLHAATKQYVDAVTGGLPPGSADAVLRHNGSSWAVAAGVTIDSGGGLSATSIASLGNIAGVNIAPQGQLLQAGEFGVIETSGFTPDDLKMPAGLNGQTLRHNGINWIASGALINNGTDVDCTGAMTATSFVADDFIGAGNLTPAGRLLQAGGFGAVEVSPNSVSDFALNSDLNGYLPLSGGTLTGQLNGTDIIASGIIGSGQITDEQMLKGGGFGAVENAGFTASEVVRTNTTQTISGAKTFTSEVNCNATMDINGICQVRDTLSVGTATAPTGGASIRVADSIQSSNWGSDGGSNIVGNIGSELKIESSDERLKEHIEDSPYGLETLMQLQPRTFNWKQTGVPDTGFIAQEVADLLPDAVPENPDGFLGFRLNPVVATLVKAVQEQQKQIEQLTALVQEMQS